MSDNLTVSRSPETGLRDNPVCHVCAGFLLSRCPG